MLRGGTLTSGTALIGLEAGPDRTVRKEDLYAEGRGEIWLFGNFLWMRGDQPQCASIAYLFRPLPKGWKAAWGDRSPWVG